MRLTRPRRYRNAAGRRQAGTARSVGRLVRVRVVGATQPGADRPERRHGLDHGAGAAWRHLRAGPDSDVAFVRGRIGGLTRAFPRSDHGCDRTRRPALRRGDERRLAPGACPAVAVSGWPAATGSPDATSSSEATVAADGSVAAVVTRQRLGRRVPARRAVAPLGQRRLRSEPLRSRAAHAGCAPDPFIDTDAPL